MKINFIQSFSEKRNISRINCKILFKIFIWIFYYSKQVRTACWIYSCDIMIIFYCKIICNDLEHLLVELHFSITYLLLRFFLVMLILIYYVTIILQNVLLWLFIHNFILLILHFCVKLIFLFFYYLFMPLIYGCVLVILTCYLKLYFIIVICSSFFLFS